MHPDGGVPPCGICVMRFKHNFKILAPILKFSAKLKDGFGALLDQSMTVRSEDEVMALYHDVLQTTDSKQG